MLPINFFKLRDANPFFGGERGGGGSYEVDTEVIWHSGKRTALFMVQNIWGKLWSRYLAKYNKYT